MICRAPTRGAPTIFIHRVFENEYVGAGLVPARKTAENRGKSRQAKKTGFFTTN